MTVQVDVTVIMQALVGVASVVLPIIAGFIYKEVILYCHIGNNTATAARVQQGVDAISDIALSYLQKAAANGLTVSVSGVVSDALREVGPALLEAAQRQGTTPEQLAARVTGSLIAKATAAPAVPVAATPPLTPISVIAGGGSGIG